MEDFIPVNRPSLLGKEKDYISECLETGWISSEGPFVERFENEFAHKVGRRFGVAVCNGSAALDLAVSALDIRPGDEVIMPSFTIISCAAAVARAGAKPVLVDSRPDSWNMDVDDLERYVSPRTKAIMPVHIYGLPVDMGPVLKFAEAHSLRIIEDAAEAHGQSWREQPCGSFGDLSTFSFYPNKHITTGEGGMVVTDVPELAERLRAMRNLCFQPGRRFVHEELGWNHRMTNLQAALGVAQLERLDAHMARKREIGARYSELLRAVPGLQLPLETDGNAANVYWVYGLVLSDAVPFDAAEMMARLAKRGIGTRPFFWPMHEQPVFQKRGWYAGEHHPVAERLARRGFYLPSGLGTTDAEINRAAAAVRAILADATTAQ